MAATVAGDAIVSAVARAMVVGVLGILEGGVGESGSGGSRVLGSCMGNGSPDPSLKDSGFWIGSRSGLGQVDPRCTMHMWAACLDSAWSCLLRPNWVDRCLASEKCLST